MALNPRPSAQGRIAAGALERLNVISTPASDQASVLDTLKAGLRSVQEAIEGRQQSAFGAGSSSRLDSAMLVTSLCPLHGPIVQSATAELLYKYRSLSLPFAKLAHTPEPKPLGNGGHAQGLHTSS